MLSTNKPIFYKFIFFISLSFLSLTQIYSLPKVGEKLSYVGKVAGIKVLGLELNFKEKTTYENQESYHFSSYVYTLGPLKAFGSVEFYNNSYWSVADQHTLYSKSLMYSKKQKKMLEIIKTDKQAKQYWWMSEEYKPLKEKPADKTDKTDKKYMIEKKEGYVKEFAPMLQDFISVFYYPRFYNKKIKEGASYVVPVATKEKILYLKIDILKKEEISVLIDGKKEERMTFKVLVERQNEDEKKKSSLTKLHFWVEDTPDRYILQIRGRKQAFVATVKLRSIKK